MDPSEETGTLAAADRPGDADPPPATRRWSAERTSLLALVAYLVVAAPLILLVLGRHRWFLSDEWSMIAGRDVDGFGGLFEPNNAHWVTLPAISYSVLWHLVGLRSYLPYQAVLVALHVTVVILLRAVMRRAEIDPWLATAAAAALVLFGPGSDDIIWAFQIGFAGSLAFGLVHLLLVADDPPMPAWRDGLGLAAGLGALMCSGVGVVMVAGVAVATLLRRGWRAALVQAVPLAATYGLWVVLADPQTEALGGRPPLGELVEWVVSGVVGVFMGLGRYWPIALVLAGMLVVGVARLLLTTPVAEARRRLAGPVGLAVAGVAFSVSTALGRWILGPDAARSSRYVYVGAALTLPLIALGADVLRRRWPALMVVALAAFVIPIPGNATDFESPGYGEAYFAEHRRVFYSVTRASFAEDVPPDVRPLPNPFIIDEVDIGFLLGLQEDGKLRSDASTPLTPRIEEEMRVRLGVAQRRLPAFGAECRVETGPLEISPERGTTFDLQGPVSIVTRVGAEVGAEPVTFRPVNGGHLTIELDDMDLIIRPPFGASELEWCDPL